MSFLFSWVHLGRVTSSLTSAATERVNAGSPPSMFSAPRVALLSLPFSRCLVPRTRSTVGSHGLSAAGHLALDLPAKASTTKRVGVASLVAEIIIVSI